MDEIIISVKGMTCNHCRMTVTKAIMDAPGVKSAEVNLEENSAKVRYNIGKITPDEIVSRIKKAGYEAQIN